MKSRDYLFGFLSGFKLLPSTTIALKQNNLEGYYGKSDALFFMDKESHEIYKLHCEGKSDEQILETIQKLWTIK